MSNSTGPATNTVVNKTQEKPEETKQFFETPATDTKLTKTTSEPETVVAPVIDKTATKAKNFSVEFTSKGGNNAKKGVQAKKITNFDLDSLSLEESGNNNEKKETGMMSEFSLGFGANTSESTTTTTSTSNGYEAKTTSYSGYGSNSNGKSEEDVQEKIKKFSNAKAISSDAFYGKNK